MNWLWIFNNILGFLLCFIVFISSLMGISLSILIFLNKLREKTPKVHMMSIATIVFCVLLISSLIHYGLFTGFRTTDKESIIMFKAEEILDAKTGYIQKGQGPLHYRVTVNKEEYMFNISEIGMHLDSIYQNGNLVYESTKENIDESLMPLQKVATAKVREITGNQSAFIEESLGRGEYLIVSGDKIFTVKVNRDNEEVDYVLHNDTYIYKK